MIFLGACLWLFFKFAYVVKTSLHVGISLTRLRKIYKAALFLQAFKNLVLIVELEGLRSFLRDCEKKNKFFCKLLHRRLINKYVLNSDSKHFHMYPCHLCACVHVCMQWVCHICYMSLLTFQVSRNDPGYFTSPSPAAFLSQQNLG